MTELDRLKIKHACLYGEYLGFLSGLLWWDIPEKLKNLVKETKEKLEAEFDAEYNKNDTA